MPTGQTNYISTADIAQFLGISRIAVFKRIKKGQIKAIKIGRSYAIPQATIKKQFPAFPLETSETKEYISVMDAANLYQVSRNTVLNWIKKGLLGAKRIGRHYVIAKDQIANLESPESLRHFLQDKEFVSVPEAAQIFGISRIAIFQRIKKGRIKAKKVGRHYAIAREDLPVFGPPIEKARVDAGQYLSVMDAAQQLGISRIVVFKRIKEGSIKAIKIGRSYAIGKADLRSLL